MGLGWWNLIFYPGLWLTWLLTFTVWRRRPLVAEENIAHLFLSAIIGSLIAYAVVIASIGCFVYSWYN